MQQNKLRLITRRIEALEKRDLRKAKISDLEDELSDIMKGWATRPLLVEAKDVFRVRPNSSSELFRTVGDLWYPPRERTLRLGRANDIGKPVFYCADSVNTAFIENKITTVNDSYTVLKCSRVHKNPMVVDVGVHPLTARHNPNVGGTAPDGDTELRETLRRNGSWRGNELIRSFLLRQFSKIVLPGEEHQYKITIAASQLLLSSNVDGICYPSVSSNSMGVNIAFKTEAVDRLYRPVECSVIRVLEIVGNPGYLVQETHRAKSIAQDWEINWE
jgi:hypothetical protein